MRTLDTCPICNSTDTGTWIECDGCGQWFHSVCLKITQAEINEILAYHCDKCSIEFGPSLFKRRSKRAKVNIDYVALNDGDSFAIDKSIHPHVHKFHEFKINASKGTYVDILNDLTFEYATSTHLIKPILVPYHMRGKVGMKLPCDKELITIDYILKKVGPDTSVEVMDVLSQQGVSPGWDMQQWRDYFVTDESSRDRIRNVISLEISDVKGFGKCFKRPDMVDSMDLIDKTWNDEFERPQVTKYCLMSVDGSFTDFHIDFGGTSVYYTVCSGSKTFLMFPPTSENLELYTSWCLEQNQNYMWYPDYSKPIKGRSITPTNGFKVTLNPGDVFIIPSGWIHCVYTPEDSLVIGGNFLTIMNMKTQLDIYNIEKQTNVPMKFRHPQFNKVIWLSAWYYLNHKDEFFVDIGYKFIKQETPIKETHIKDIAIKETPGTPVNQTPDIDIKDFPKDNSLTDSTLTNNSSDPFHPQIILSTILTHLKNHYQLSKTNQTAKKSVPHIIKDVAGFLADLQSWINDLT